MLAEAPARRDSLSGSAVTIYCVSTGSRLSLPLFIGAGAFVVAALGNILLIVGSSHRGYGGDFISAYALGVVADLVIAAALAFAAVILRRP
ncbi:MAG TPA: hypothetical protein VMJ49_11445 [Gaiellaceae bacterium]|nr:hypothetical protein [Gaiellaceae bacterium]